MTAYVLTGPLGTWTKARAPWICLLPIEDKRAFVDPPYLGTQELKRISESSPEKYLVSNSTPTSDEAVN